MKKKIFILALMISFILPVYADTVLFMKPVTKEIEKSDANKIIKNLESTVSSKLNSVSYKDVSKAKLKKFGKCGMKPECWSENATDEDFQYVLLSLVSMNEDEEVSIRLVLINIEYEEVVDDDSKTYDYADNVTAKAVFSQVRKLSAYGDIKTAASRKRKARSTNAQENSRKSARKESSNLRDSVKKKHVSKKSAKKESAWKKKDREERKKLR